jgi:hypothetical protein
MSKRNTKQNTISNNLLILGLGVGGLLLSWIRDLFLNGWSIKSAYNILIVLLFLVCSYYIEVKTPLTDKMRIVIYFLYFFVIGTFASTIIYQNQLNGQMIFLYLFLSFIGSLIWLFFCKQLNTKNKL